MSAELPADSPNDKHRFLLGAAEFLHRYGAPSHRLENAMEHVSASINVNGVFLYTPTALVVSLGGSNDGGNDGGEKVYLRRVDSGAVDASKLWDFDDVLERLEHGEITVNQARQLMQSVAASPPPFSGATTSLAYSMAAGTVAVLFGGGILEVAISALFGLVVSLIERLSSRWGRGLFEPIVGAVVAFSTLTLSTWCIRFDYRLTTLAALIVVVPGLSLTVAFTELAVGHLSAGVARLAGACVTLLTLVIGVAFAWKLSESWAAQDVVGQAELPSWTYWLAISIAPSAFAILFRVRFAQWPIIYVVCLIGVTAHNLAISLGSEIAAFLAAFAVGCSSNFYARWQNRPALIPSTPGILILVPGAIGYRSLSALLENQVIVGIDFAIATLLIAMSLVGGLLAAGVIVSPKRIL